jgi:hypothetical protein
MSLVKRRKDAFRLEFESASQEQNAMLILKSIERFRDVVCYESEPLGTLTKAAAYLARKEFTPDGVLSALDFYRRRDVSADSATMARISEILWAVRQAAAPNPFSQRFAPPSRRRSTRTSREETGDAVRPSRGEAPRVVDSRDALKPEKQAVMGLHEVAAFMKVSRQTITNWRTHRPEFPKPTAHLKLGPIWRTKDISKFQKLRAKR